MNSKLFSIKGLSAVSVILFLLFLVAKRPNKSPIEPIDGSNTEPPVTTVAWSMKGVNAIARLESSLYRSPDNLNNRIALAQAYLSEAQQTLQESFYIPKSQEQIDAVLSREPNHFQGLALQASLFNTLHQFEKARALATELIEREPGHAYIFGILVDALVELGEYDEAVSVCDKMISLRPGITSFSRAAYLRELHGDTEGAIAAMKLAADAGVMGAMDRSWALFQLGQLYLGQNEVDKAALIFEGILDETPFYAYAIAGEGQVALQKGDLETAQLRFEEAYAFVAADKFLEGLIEVNIQRGNQDAVEVLVAQIQSNLLDADKLGENVRMEYADFLADHEMKLETALKLAQLEYMRRPNHLHALETYAWALHKNERSEEAIQYIEQAMRMKTGDAMVYFRAGMIYRSANRLSEAEYYLEQALKANLHIESPSAASKASALLG